MKFFTAMLAVAVIAACLSAESHSAFSAPFNLAGELAVSRPERPNADAIPDARYIRPVSGGIDLVPEYPGSVTGIRVFSPTGTLLADFSLHDRTRRQRLHIDSPAGMVFIHIRAADRIIRQKAVVYE